LFQKPAHTPEEIAASRPLEIQPAEVATFDEEAWYRRAFRGEHAPQLTPSSCMACLSQNATANLMTASITANAAASSADLLTDLKSGYLLGAHPRRQFLAQLMGVFTGTAATIIGFRLLVPDASVFTGSVGAQPTFAAPSAQAWLAVARIFQEGIDHLHIMARQGMVWKMLAGAVLTALEIALPKYRRFIPSPIGLGLGFILLFFNPFSMLLGAIGAWLWSRGKHAHAERYTVPVASGIIAGESIVSVAIALVNNVFL